MSEAWEGGNGSSVARAGTGRASEARAWREGGLKLRQQGWGHLKLGQLGRGAVKPGASRDQDLFTLKLRGLLRKAKTANCHSASDACPASSGFGSSLQG